MVLVSQEPVCDVVARPHLYQVQDGNLALCNLAAFTVLEDCIIMSCTNTAQSSKFRINCSGL